MRWVAIIEDDPAQDWVRKRHDHDHFDDLRRNADRIVIGGGLRPDPGEWYCGGLWVLEVDSRADAVRLVEGDPYFRLELRKGYRLLVGGKAPSYVPVTL